MTRLAYSRDEILAEHAYARPQIEAGYQLHGGFAEDGTYLSPRTLNRWPAVHAWQDALRARGGDLIDASQDLLKRPSYPTVEQQRFLLSHGVGQTLWNELTVVGVVEARGGMLAQAVAPDFQEIVVEDISETTLGHLNLGLLAAHGWDEGGRKESGERGHDAMWFAVRDALFGKDAYPWPEVPPSLARPESGRRLPQIPLAHEEWILLLMNVLMIEVKAESFFTFCQLVMRDPANFADRRAAAEHAAELVGRIRTDEAIHVAYLQTALSELRGLTIKLRDGSHISGAALIDPVWDQMIAWHAVTQADHGREQTRGAILHRLKCEANGAALAAQFDSLEYRMAAE